MYRAYDAIAALVMANGFHADNLDGIPGERTQREAYQKEFQRLIFQDLGRQAGMIDQMRRVGIRFSTTEVKTP